MTVLGRFLCVCVCVWGGGGGDDFTSLRTMETMDLLFSRTMETAADDNDNDDDDDDDDKVEDDNGHLEFFSKNKSWKGKKATILDEFPTPDRVEIWYVD